MLVCFLNVCFGEIFHPFQVNMRKIWQFVGETTQSTIAGPLALSALLIASPRGGLEVSQIRHCELSNYCYIANAPGPAPSLNASGSAPAVALSSTKKQTSP